MSESKYKLNTMRHWYIFSKIYDDEKYYFISGQFFNRPGFYEGMLGSSSNIKSITLDEEEKEYKIQTKNTLYHCSFDSILFELQDTSEYELPEYKRIKSAYYVPVDKSNLGKNDMILVLADYQEFYFDSLIYRNEDGSEGKYSGYPHIGMFTDTYLISGDNEYYDNNRKEAYIDIRYYVSNQGIEFYSTFTGGKNLWIENRGETPIEIGSFGQCVLQPGQRILYKEVN